MVVRDGFSEELALKLRCEGHVVAIDDGHVEGTVFRQRPWHWQKPGIERKHLKNTLALSLKKQASYKRNKMNMHQ